MIRGYGITLETLTENHLEMVRNWRNLPEVSANMEYTKTITVREQLAWFKSLKTQPNFYYVINYNNQMLGLTHLNNFDAKEKCAHAGLFIANNKFFGTGVSFGVSLIILQHGFATLGLQTIYAKIKNSNKQAILYNKTLGFVFEKKLNKHFSLYQLTSEVFDKKKTTLDNLVKHFLV